MLPRMRSFSANTIAICRAVSCRASILIVLSDNPKIRVLSRTTGRMNVVPRFFSSRLAVSNSN